MPNNPRISFKLVGIAAVDSTLSSREIEVLEGAHAMAAAAGAWRHLEKNGGAATPFQSYCVASSCAAAHMQKEAMPRIVVVRKDGEPRIIVPTVVTQLFGFSVVRFLGDPLIQYADVIASGDVDEDDLTEALIVAADPRIACLALFRRVRSDAKIGKSLAVLAREIAMDESPLVDLRLPPVLTARTLREQRRQRRRLSERGELQVRVMLGAEARPWLVEALKLKREWMSAQGFTSLVVGSPDWEKALHHICSAEASQLVAAVMMCGGSLAAVEIAFVDATSWLGFIGAYAPEFAAYSPGQILAVECMQWARDRGLTVYDQLPPSQPYKRRHATHSVSVRDYAMPLTPMAKLPLAMIKMIPSLKWILAEIPEDLRRAILKLAG